VVPWWHQTENIEIARSMAWPMGMLAMGLLVLLGMVRPGIKLMKTPALPAPEPIKQLDAVLDEVTERPDVPMLAATDNEPTPEMLRLADARRLALDNPIAVANIVKGWVNGDAAAA
jgi:flagellar M-ring protein FliF